MMKVKLKYLCLMLVLRALRKLLPKWADERHIRIFAGIEEVARKLHGRSWQIKTVRCNMCGKCCMNVPSNWKFGRNEKTGNCKHLKLEANDYLCNLGANRPFMCSAGDGWEGECNIRQEEL